MANTNHPDYRVGGNGKVQVPYQEGMKKQHWRWGKAPRERFYVEGVPTHAKQGFKKAAKDNNMSMAVYMTFLGECLNDDRVVVLPPSHSIEEYIDGRFRDLMNREIDKAVAKVLGRAGVADPYVR